MYNLFTIEKQRKMIMISNNDHAIQHFFRTFLYPRKGTDCIVSRFCDDDNDDIEKAGSIFSFVFGGKDPIASAGERRRR